MLALEQVFFLQNYDIILFEVVCETPTQKPFYAVQNIPRILTCHVSFERSVATKLYFEDVLAV